MDEEDDFEEIEIGDEDEDEFLEFMSRLTVHNRARLVRKQIERREESRRLGDLLGLDDFELGVNY